ncbi:hypothetical protein N7537_005980 [Penicillium hordei]|uniref:Uncharacterized protein n=1 Tax=Penicillium hordei TaxID=40994 RepID=A0AAD6H4R9_9EURO|nr:uncharacterized protein N7537_005980 [Penicillium hordei]KAJ5603024.1 hypothetical protein N7537_005980 [Penicillium hordei]
MLKIKAHSFDTQFEEKSLPRGIEPRSPALIGINDKRKSSPLDQGRCDGRVTARPLGWLMEGAAHYGFMSKILDRSSQKHNNCRSFDQQFI